jgi:uncharacterized membrane protein YdjX (TVP38/TMEM64 family)
MKEIFLIIYEFIINSVSSSTVWGPILASILIIIESIIPVLPLFVFITVIFLAYGNILGFIISWVCTCIGCLISYLLVKYLTNKYIKTNSKKLNNLIKVINKIDYSNLVVLIAIPFTPAFLINIACGMSKIDIKKFMSAIMIGKISLVWFWGFIGTSLIESLKDPVILIKVLLVVLMMFIISKVYSKKMKID